jgi:hypothetical protein
LNQENYLNTPIKGAVPFQDFLLMKSAENQFNKALGEDDDRQLS